MRSNRMFTFFMYSRYNNLFKGVSWVVASSIIGSVLQFLLIFVLLNFYKQEEFGLWASITSIAAVIVTGDFGIVNVLRNIISREVLNGSKGLAVSKQYFYSALIFFMCLAILLSIILLFISSYIPFEHLFKTDNEVLRQQGRAIFLIIQFIFLFNIPFGMGIPLFFSFGESKLYSIVNSVRSIVAFMIVLCLSINKIHITSVAVAYFTSNLLISLLGTLYFIHKRKWFTYSFNGWDCYHKIREMLTIGVKFLSVQLFSSFLQNVLTIYVGSMVGLGVAANINVVQKIFSFFGGIYQSAFNPLWSELASAFQKRNYDWCWSLLKKSVCITITFFSFVVIIVSVLGDFFMKFIAGNEFKPNVSMFILVGILFSIRIVFDNVSLLQNATNKLNTIIYGYSIMFVYVLIVIPWLVQQYGIELMILNLIFMWGLFIVLAYWDLRKIINNRKNIENSCSLNKEEL